MTKIINKIAITLVLAALSVTAMAAPKTLRVHLEGVGDGDTIYVRNTEERASYRVRLAMIDAPEKNQDYGTQSKQALQQLLRGVGVINLQVYGTDRYGRLIAVVEDERKRNINVLMVNQGAAWVYTEFARRPEFSRYYSEIVGAERNAKSQRIGLWANPNAVEPWRFRRSK